MLHSLWWNSTQQRRGVMTATCDTTGDFKRVILKKISQVEAGTECTSPCLLISKPGKTNPSCKIGVSSTLGQAATKRRREGRGFGPL